MEIGLEPQFGERIGRFFALASRMQLNAELTGGVGASANKDELGAGIIEEVRRIKVDKALVLKFAFEWRRVFRFARGWQAGAGRGSGFGILDSDNDAGLLTNVELLLCFAGIPRKFKGVRKVSVIFVTGNQIYALAGRTCGGFHAFAASLGLVLLRIEFLVELSGTMRDEINESPCALVLLDVRQAFASDDDATENRFGRGLENGVEALHVAEAVDRGDVKPWAVEEEDVAAFENFRHAGP